MNERASFLCDTVGSVMTVYVRGEIDHHTAVAVRNGIDALLFEKRPSKMMMDLSAVGFMDSSGLGLIMGRLSVMRSFGGDMILQNPSRETSAILSLAGMERLIRIEYTREDPSDRAAVSGERPPVQTSRPTGTASAGQAPRRRKRTKAQTPSVS